MTSAQLRELTPAVLAVVARRTRDFGAAEDAVQEALLAASQQWPSSGPPDNPRGWLVHVALRRLTDQARSDIARRQREDASAVAVDETSETPEPEKDDTLVLLLMCCHPSLTPASAVALTLRAVGGLSTAEIAHAYMVPEATMAQRISRAKQTVARSAARFAMPAPAELGDRVSAVLHVLYLIFNEGYATSSGAQLVRSDLASEAIRLARGLRLVLPDHAELAGLVALMVLTDARRAARATADGELIPLDEQDRALWDRAMIDEGVALLSETLPRGAIGPYQLQAAIAAVHDEAPSTDATDWPQIAALYSVLLRIADNPMIRLNHAIAVAMVDGPQRGLDLIERLELDSHRVDAVRGHLYERLGELPRAIAHYRAAADRTTSTPERNYLLLKAARLT